MYKSLNVKTENTGSKEVTHGANYSNIDFDYTWEEDNSVEYKGLVLSERAGDFPCPEGVKLGDKLILVFVTYRTGDSFGSSTGNTVEVALFNLEEIDKAKELVSLIQKDYEQNPEYSFEKKGNLIKYDGRKISTTTWKGYFEQLQSVDYQILEVVDTAE